jgi:putative PEP-CTERM system TPR-repeat lipoprotein
MRQLSYHTQPTCYQTAASILAILVSALLASCSSGSSARFLAHGETLGKQKEYSKAIIEFRNASRLDPKSAEPYYQAGLVYLAMGDYRAGYLALVHATELNPKHAAAQAKLAEVIGSNAASTRDPEVLREAQQRIQSALAIVPENADALGALGMTEYLLGKPGDAAKHFEAALEKVPKHLQSAKALATIKLNQKDFAGAEQILRDLANRPPPTAEPWVAVGRFYLLNRRVSEAEAAFRQAIAVNPKHGQALLDLAQLQLNSGRKEDAEKTLATLSALPDRQYRGLHAIFLFEQGKHAEAIKEFERQASENLDDREAFQRLVFAYFFSNQLADSERVINAALKRNSRNSEALLQRSRLFIATSRFSEAQTDLYQLLKLLPNLAAAHYLLSKVHQARGDELARRDQLGAAIQFEPALLSARLELAEALLATRGGAKSALDLLNQTPADQASSLSVLMERNWVLFRIGDLAEARKNVDRALTLYKAAPDLLLQDGLLRIENKDYAGARKSLESVLSVQPQSAAAVDALAQSYLAQKQPVLALQTVQRLAAQQPKAAPIQQLLGRWSAANGRFTEARQAYSAAMAIDPSAISAQIAAAYVEIADGKFEVAKRILEAVPHSAATSLPCELGLAQVEERAGNPGAAIPHYRKALEVNADNVPALNGLAYNLAAHTGQLDEALKYAQQAKEFAPNDPYVADTLGWVYFLKGQYVSAVDHLRLAAQKEGMVVPKYHLAMAYFKTGHSQQGLRLFQEALNANPNLPEAALAEKLLFEAGARSSR